jgi:hypothetical protein
MAIYYLDVDDEITSAAARIRDSGDTRIALVLSVGSRVATSRINFRLLAGEAKHRNKRLAIIASDPSVQSVARSADLPVYSSVGEYEKAEAALAGAVRGGSGAAAGSAVSGALDELSRTVGPAKQPARGVVRGTSRVPAAAYGNSPEPAIRIRIPWPVVAGLAFLALIIIVTSIVFVYPSASVVLTLRGEQVGPMTVSVKVDPSVSATNYQADTFQATGQKVVETAASGTVTFTSYNTFIAVPIPAGTQLSTNSNVQFTTTAGVTVKKAAISGGGSGIVPGTADVAVTAVAKGLGGNVAAATIVNLSTSLANSLVGPNPVTNKQPTAGGTHDVTPEVQQSDITAATIDLSGKLEASFKAAWQAPGAAPSGSSVLANSAVLDLATCDQDPQSLLGQDVPTFQLACQAQGSVTTADPAAISDLAKRRVAASVKSGYALVESSVTTKAAAGSTLDSAFVVPVTVTAIEVPVIDVARIKAAIQGKSVDDARTYLSQFGAVDISMSPGWSGSMPTFDFRIDIQVVDPTSSGSSPTPSAGTPSPTSPAILPAGQTANATTQSQPSIPNAATPPPETTIPSSAGSSDTPAAPPSVSPSA